MGDICDFCSKTEEPEYGDCPDCGGHFCEEHLHPDHHKCPERPEPPDA